MSTLDEITELEKNVDELIYTLAALDGDPDAIAKAALDMVPEDELAKIEAQVDEAVGDVEQELNKRIDKSWNSCVEKIATEENLSTHIAMSQARKRYPDVFDALQKSAGPAPHNRISGFAPLVGG